MDIIQTRPVIIKKKTSLIEWKPQQITDKLKSKLCKMKRNKPRGREWGPSHRRLDFPFVYISIFAFKRLIELFIRIIVLIIKLSAKLSSRSSLAFLKALVECRWAQLVIVIACVVSISPPFLLLDLAVGEWPRQWFWGCEGFEHLFDSGSKAIVYRFWGHHWRRRRRRFFKDFVRCVLCF